MAMGMSQKVAIPSRAASGDLAVLHLVCEFVRPNPSLQRTRFARR